MCRDLQSNNLSTTLKNYPNNEYLKILDSYVVPDSRLGSDSDIKGWCLRTLDASELLMTKFQKKLKYITGFEEPKPGNSTVQSMETCNFGH